MKNINLLTIKLLLICISLNVSAQVPDNTLAQQYHDVVTQSGSYKVYKNIRKTKIEQLWKNVTDSLQLQKTLLNESRARLAEREKLITELKGRTESQKSPVAGLIPEDISVSSTASLWGLVILLGAALVFVFVRSRSALKEASYRSELYDELTTEFREYKSKANEKERKLARELQDERNLVEELKGKKGK
ncbi:MAG: hypothetical protein WC220_12280 [Pedobacter sp.]|jgi:hypothetical protein